MGKKSKNWFQKLQPGKLVGALVSKYVPGGSHIVDAYRNVEDAVKRTVQHRPIAYEAASRGVTATQVAAEQGSISTLPPKLGTVPAPASSSSAGIPPLVIAGVLGLVAFLLFGRRR